MLDFLDELMGEWLDWNYSRLRTAILFVVFLLFTIAVPVAVIESRLPEEKVFLHPLLEQVFYFKFEGTGFDTILNALKTIITIVPVLLVVLVEESLFRILGLFGFSNKTILGTVFSYVYFFGAAAIAFCFVLFLIRRSFIGAAVSKYKERRKWKRTAAKRTDREMARDEIENKGISGECVPKDGVACKLWSKDPDVQRALYRLSDEEYLNSREGILLRQYVADGLSMAAGEYWLAVEKDMEEALRSKGCIEIDRKVAGLVVKCLLGDMHYELEYLEKDTKDPEKIRVKVLRGENS